MLNDQEDKVISSTVNEFKNKEKHAKINISIRLRLRYV